MDPIDRQRLDERRAERARTRRRRALRRRIGAGAVLVIVVAAIVVIVVGASGGSTSHPGQRAADHTSGGAAVARHGQNKAKPAATRPAGGDTAAALGPGTGRPGNVTVPILMYHVIAPPPAGAPFPDLYVLPSEFAAEMQGLKDAGWHAVTLDQVWANWTKGVTLPAKPIVLTFDNGYHSQYASALPVLRQLHWVADENMQLTGLPPSQGGLTDAEIHVMVDDGWELDTQGISHADLPDLTASELEQQIASARTTVQRRFGVPVNWFCYPSGQYNATVIAAVKAAGYRGSTTVVPGWARRPTDPYTLPRLRIVGGTSPAALLAQIASAESAAAPPGSYLTSS